MKEIKIVSKWDNDKVLLFGQYESVKDCLKKNHGADLRGAYLCGAYLSGADLSGADLSGAYLSDVNLYGADLRGADLSGAYLSGAYLCGAYLCGAYLSGAYLSGADLFGADLRGADLRGADLRGADLRGADLRSATGYLSSHDFFQEIVKQQDSKTFTSKEWVCIGQIIVHRLCWDSIKKRFNKEAMSVFKKLAKVGFDEWEKHFKETFKRRPK